MSAGELKLFLSILPKYTEHLVSNPNSLLAKIFGVFTVKQDSTNAVFVMLMENTLRIKDGQDLIHLFDLKGSVVDRESAPSAGTLKDTNFKNMTMHSNLF